MKPISVRFKCFGPYVEEQFIDFEDLQKSGLFLICGETGAGKTTILDAMCYALYGKSSGGSRGKLEDMRCKKAGRTEETFVEYCFSSGENSYRFYRGLIPKKQQKASIEAGKPLTFNEEYACQILRDGEYVPMSDTKAIQGYMDKKAEEILGLEYTQFKQVIILPQGQFEKLLTSNSDEKEKILVSLFHAEKYEKITKLLTDKLSEEEKALKLEKLLMEQKLNILHCGNLEELQVLKERTEQEEKELQQQYHALEEEVLRRKKALEQARKDDEGFCALENAEKKLAVLSMQQSRTQEDKKRLKKARDAEGAAPAYEEFQRAEKNYQKAGEVLRQREKMLENAQKRIETLEQEKKAHEENRSGYENQKRQKILLEGLQELYQSLNGKEKACKDAEDEMSKARKVLEKAEEALAFADQTLARSVLAQKEAEAAFHQGQELYLQSIGAILAENLREGEKCPVCGSCHHPEPAKPGEAHISEKELENLNKANRKALKDLEKDTRERTQADQQKQAAEISLSACRKDVEAAEKIYREALSRRAEGIETEKQRLDRLKLLAKAIGEFEDADKSMQDRVTAADIDLKTQTQRRKDAEGEAQAAVKNLDAARSSWLAAAESAGFTEEKAYLEACMEPAAQQALQVKTIQFDTDLKNADLDVQQKKAALGDRLRPDAAGAAQALEEAEKQKEAVSSRLSLKNKALQDQKADLSQLQKQWPLWEQKKQRNEANMDFAVKLRGDKGIGLQRYVLGVMLTTITNAANQLLKTVYGGRYQLYRTNESSGNVRKKGLELEVADQDGLRNVNTLSGGEKFLLSLSLGIGLATVVQARGNGIRLEAMFIDEGFGSLDEKSIDDALEILETVRSGSGMVGIISHVERLAETIPAKIQITKTKNGSRCKVSC